MHPHYFQEVSKTEVLFSPPKEAYIFKVIVFITSYEQAWSRTE